MSMQVQITLQTFAGKCHYCVVHFSAFSVHNCIATSTAMLKFMTSIQGRIMQVFSEPSIHFHALQAILFLVLGSFVLSQVF